MVEAVQAQPVLDKFTPGNARGKGIKLCAIADNPGKLLRLRRSDAQNADGAVGWPDEPGHEVHERGLSRAVGPHQACDSG